MIKIKPRTPLQVTKMYFTPNFLVNVIESVILVTWFRKTNIVRFTEDMIVLYRVKEIMISNNFSVLGINLNAVKVEYIFYYIVDCLNTRSGAWRTHTYTCFYRPLS